MAQLNVHVGDADPVPRISQRSRVWTPHDAPNHVQDAHADATSKLGRAFIVVVDIKSGHVVHNASAPEQLQVGSTDAFSAYLVQAWDVCNSCKHNGAVPLFLPPRWGAGPMALMLWLDLVI
jgi:hypothetical protein